MRVLMINPGHDGTHHQHKSHRAVHRDPMPLGCLYAGSTFKEQGHEVHILDTHITRDWRTAIYDNLILHRPDYVGISVIIGQPMANAREIQDFIKSIDPTVTVTWGGVMPTVMPEEIRGVYHPDRVHAGGFQPQHVDYSLLKKHLNPQQTPYYSMVMTSVGCPFNCSFCYKHSVSSVCVLKSVAEVKREMHQLYHLTQSPVFTFGDDNALINKNRALEILNYVRENGWYIEELIAHISNVDDDLIEAMSGVVSTFICSIETVNKRLQRILNKRVHTDRALEKIAKLEQAGIVSTVSFMEGLPGETEGDRDANQEYMERLRRAAPLVRGNCYLWFPLPGTKLTEYAEKHYDVDLHFSAKEYEESSFWCKDPEDPTGVRFRPYMSMREYQMFYVRATLFNIEFKRAKRVYKLAEILDNNDTVSI